MMKSQEQAKRAKSPTPAHDSWARPRPRVRPCLRCGRPRISGRSSACPTAWHDPKARAERAAAKVSLIHQLGQVRAALTGAHPRIGQDVLELLVLERRVTVDDVRGAMARYRLGGSA